MLRGLLFFAILLSFTTQGPLTAQDTEKRGANREPGTENRELAGEAQNALKDSRSPYLLQHADNPVAWRPWGDEAFALAQKTNKPVFLSIGYSTCHWCHVMEHESFEDPETAAVLNEHFIPVKVDREERPDVDRIYMNYQQAVHGGGGWPLSVWLTPDRVPFFTGTYFPKDAKGGQVSFLSILDRVREAWSLHGEDIAKDSTRILGRLREVLAASSSSEPGAPAPGADLPARAASDLAKIYDPVNGGFGSHPKFPQPVLLDFLLEHSAALGGGDPEGARALEMAETTLERIARGGIHDHLGGGFHRYSVDDFWHVPHFEKMLYDQARIASACLDAFHLTGRPRYAAIARGIFDYVERDLSHPGGAFYCAEDADSLVPPSHATLEPKSEIEKSEIKKEGAFYLWTVAEVEELLGPEAPLFIAAYGMSAGGNAPEGSDPFEEFTGRNILLRKKTAAELAADFGKPEAEVEAALARARQSLLAERGKRPRPHLDDKILTDWNALMISAYAKAHLVLGISDLGSSISDLTAAGASSSNRKSEIENRKSPYLDRAVSAATFLLEHLYDSENKTLSRSWREGPSAAGTAEDYAFFVQALLDLHEASLELKWLRLALELQDRQIELLHDGESGGFFDAPAARTDLILRLKSIDDGATPSANAVSALNLIRLGSLVKSASYDAVLDSLFKYAGADLASAPVSHAALLAAWARRLAGPAQIVVVGARGDPATAAIIARVRSRYHPNKVVLLLEPAGADREFLNARNPLFAAFEPLAGAPTLYLCRGFTCQEPTADLQEIEAQLTALQARKNR